MLICEDFFNIAARSLICDVQCTSDTCRVVKSSNTPQNSNTDPISKKKEHMDVQTLIEALGKTLSLEAGNTVRYLKQRNFDCAITEDIQGNHHLENVSILAIFLYI